MALMKAWSGLVLSLIALWIAASNLRDSVAGPSIASRLEGLDGLIYCGDLRVEDLFVDEAGPPSSPSGWRWAWVVHDVPKSSAPPQVCARPGLRGVGLLLLHYCRPHRSISQPRHVRPHCASPVAHPSATPRAPSSSPMITCPRKVPNLSHLCSSTLSPVRSPNASRRQSLRSAFWHMTSPGPFPPLVWRGVVGRNWPAGGQGAPLQVTPPRRPSSWAIAV